MDSDQSYDQKFEEMKKYIPFLESMIKRLESTGVSSGNPRQAQLDKIRSLRDLLLDKKKRMKMENLLKCEQVLVNLYAKVEQRDTKLTPIIQKEHKSTEKPDLSVVRNKLKSVAMRPAENTDTLPEIARAHDVDVSTTGSKEPALFQRRPNKFSKSPFSSPTVDNMASSPQSSSRRSYTRILMSPETSSRRWDRSSSSDKPLFSRRSPRRSPRRLSPAYSKKERRKLAKRNNVDSKKRKDWNITLNVPAESLNSLNTTDILSRIINCSDSDVDIDTLRELRSQILVELKQTRGTDDISDLILKSYKTKKNKTETKGSRQEVEEGELSDSESEAIQSIYSSLVVVEKDSSSAVQDKTSSENEQPRKIQICLVINPDKADSDQSNIQGPKPVDVSDFEMFDKDIDFSSGLKEKQDKTESADQNKPNTDISTESIIETSIKQDDEQKSKSESTDETVNLCDESSQGLEKQNTNDKTYQSDELGSEPRKFKANFYKPLTEQGGESDDVSIEPNTSDSLNIGGSKDKPTDNVIREITPLEAADSKNNTYDQINKDVEIPLLNDRPVPTEPPKNPTVSEIDILQALKNEILNESLSLPGSEPATPALHQPKVIKIANAKEILPKNRISIEKYKQKTVSSTKSRDRLYSKDNSQTLLDNSKKTSLKLTEKECERFNLTKLAINDDVSDDDILSSDDIYGDLVPQSPDHEESKETSAPPVIIPIDPVKVATAITKGDIDMRTLVPILSSNAVTALTTSSTNSSSTISQTSEANKSEPRKTDANRTPLVDPRMKRDVNICLNKDSKSERAPCTPAQVFPNVTPNMTPINPSITPTVNPNLTPAINPNMTPNAIPIMNPIARTFEMTPQQSLEMDSNRKHVYAPVFTPFDSRECREQSVVKDTNWDRREDVPENRQDKVRSRWSDPRSSVQRDTDVQKTRYGDASMNPKGSRNERFRIDRRDSFNRSECPLTPSHDFGRSDPPMTPSYSFGSVESSTPIHPFGRSDCPPTPSHSFGRSECPPTHSNSFGRSDCPSTPIHPFGRSECPPTPSHSFGRSECPTTPIHPFSRSDCPPTPSHSFGRSECPSTPIHPFGRGDMPMTPSHPFGRSDYSHNKFNKDPRLNRSTDYERDYKNKGRDYYNDISFDQGNSYRSQNRSYNKSDNYRYNDRERGDRNRHYSQETSNRYNNRENMYRRESSDGRANQYEEERSNYRSREDRYRNEGVKGYEEVGTRRNFKFDRGSGRISHEDISRATSACRNFQRGSGGDNTLSVTRDAGHSLTINTSVKSTFQDVLSSGKEIQGFEYSFGARRQRASSVGRSLPRECTVGRTLFQSESKGNDEDDNIKKRKNNFRRACSVGRELVNSKTDRSFSEIKADFISYSKTIKIPPRRESFEDKRHGKLQDVAPLPRSRKDIFTNDNRRKSNDMKTLYSPRKNYRDPRMRREMQNDNKRREHKYDKDMKKYGMVYSSDNIAKGTVLGSGYGVKNYKIPKIKRPVEEKDEEKVEEKEVTVKPQINEKKESSSESNKSVPKKIDKSLECNKNKGSDCKLNKKVDSKESNNESTVEELPEKRMTRSRKVSEPNLIEIKNAINSRRNKKVAIIDSDKELETNEDSIGSLDENVAKAISSDLSLKKKNNVKVTEDQRNDSLASFCVDDLDMFPENMGADPVLDNINALIADLDNDIDTKTDTGDAANDFTNELSLENMLENITGMTSNDIEPSEKSKEAFDNSKNDITKESTVSSESICSTKELESNILSTDKDKLFPQNISQDVKAKQTDGNDLVSAETIENSEAIVSTTDVEAEEPNKTDMPDDRSQDGCSTPDSTINSNEAGSDKLREEIGLADSTNVDHAQSEMNSDVTSTHSVEPLETEPAEPSSLHKDTNPALESFGSLLSILQDKSKIKELLGMLGESSSENEKIKKKLEKLSEIVSDEEDTRDGTEKDDSLNDSKDASAVSEQQASCNEHPDKVEAVNTDKCEAECTGSDVNVQLAKENTQTVSVESAESDKAKIVQPDIENAAPLLEVNIGGENAEKQLANENFEAAEDDFELIDDTKVLESENVEDGSIEKIVINKSETEEKEDIDKSLEIETPKLEDIIENDETKESLIEKQDELDKSAVLEKCKPGKKKLTKKSKYVKKGKGKGIKTAVLNEPKRVTRSAVGNTEGKVTVKKPSRELLKLQEDIKEMFMQGSSLNTTGIRMCRLAKLVDEKATQDVPTNSEIEPVVMLEKFKDAEMREQGKVQQDKHTRKKPGPKTKIKNLLTVEVESKKEEKLNIAKYKPGPKSKSKPKVSEIDPYDFETDSLCDTSTTRASDEDNDSNSDSENESLASSFGSTEVLSDIKKKRKKRSGWKTGVIKTKKRKVEKKQPEPSPTTYSEESLIAPKPLTIPDSNCFIDKTYCFQKNNFTYSCRLCDYTGTDLVHHHKNNHPHCEVPMSRLSTNVAMEAIEQCETTNFRMLMKMPSERYVCRFCAKEFYKCKAAFEKFFWHVVSTHTGEYQQQCSKCDPGTCHFKIDIPPPNRDKAQLVGYTCGKCYYTQISLENLKTHVIIRHDDRETDVFSISLAEITKKALMAMNKRYELAKKPRPMRSLRSQQNVTEGNDDRSDITDSSSRISELESPQQKLSVRESTPELDNNVELDSRLVFENPSVQSQITFEAEDNNDIPAVDHVQNAESDVKLEPEEVNREDTSHSAENDMDEHENNVPVECNEPTRTFSKDVVEFPHFKLNISDSGTKEYVCCINGVENHYKTSLLISMKRHIQTKHMEKWDGYCFLCKVIVTPQGVHHFKDCLLHYIDKHVDNIPVIEKTTPNNVLPITSAKTPSMTNPEPHIVERSASPKTYINVRPLAELTVKNVEAAREQKSPLPKIENVMSLGGPVVEPPRPSPTYPTSCIIPPKEAEKPFTKYEEVQAAVMTKKYRVVLENMMRKDKLLQVFKCAGRFCSFTSDLVEEALLHASTHQRIGGIEALDCTYCDFDSSGNAIDLVMHVFKVHGRCQYSCSQCFYRGAASQLVGAHMARVHGANAADSVVLRTTNVSQPVGEDVAHMLTRDDAVSYYTCAHGEHDKMCKFRTYTPGKFYEHLQQRHSSATAHPCSICSTLASNPKQLIEHMKCHSYKLYQCTWCVHGADNETELLDHLSFHHPTKQPQAYLRIITNKDGSREQRVLPLVYLNKKKVPTEDVSPATNSENPVREAQRSLDLEKLIGHTTMLIESAESMTDPTPPIAEEPINNPDINPDIDQDISPDSEPNVPDSMESIEIQPPRMVTPQPTPAHDLSLELTPVLKTEPVECTSGKSNPDEVVCLDSDDEDDSRCVIDLSANDDRTPGKGQVYIKRFKRIPENQINKCPLCDIIYITDLEFKRHSCTMINRSKKLISCPHCQLVVLNLAELLKHYRNNHGSNEFICEICEKTFTSAKATKRHMSQSHKQAKGASMLCEVIGTEDKRYIVSLGKQKSLPERKESSESPGKRYGILDIDKLPINPIMESPMNCAICEFNTKVRLNMVRHLLCHATKRPAPNTAPVNPVPHLENNEMYFDRMQNLASSSVSTRPAPAAAPGPCPADQVLSAAEIARFPKYIPDKLRYTCGARGCTYISLNETMLRHHWDTLHQLEEDFLCAHCPPYQSVDKSRPLSALRVIAHLKMHEATLYACSGCTYYTNKLQIIEKHLIDSHKGAANALLVRDEKTEAGSSQAPAMATTAPTMDLKPWQCGLCAYKSMLRPEVVEHCTKLHHTKMQFKCSYCPYKASTEEIVTKHQTHSHPDMGPDVFYYYYREGSIPDEDGVPRWQKQRQKQDSQPKVKMEVPELIPIASQQVITAPCTSTTLTVDLNLVKKEVDTPAVEASIGELVAKYGQFCEPNGIMYKCPLCKVVCESTSEAMQSHLYEELKYRKWSCAICSYKAFHKTGLNEHMASEHRRATQQPIQLPIDVNIEKWVQEQLNHQSAIIKSNKDKLFAQKIKVPTAQKPAVSVPETPRRYVVEHENDFIGAFGPLGEPVEMQYCCPMCKNLEKDATRMRDHLESELSEIRWFCSECSKSYVHYHSAQHHCENGHAVGAPRDPSLREAWIQAVIRHQASLLHTTESQPAGPDDNSLLVVRYEVPTPQVPDLIPRRKRPPPSPQNDDEIQDDEDSPPKKKLKCQYCPYTSLYHQSIRQHVVKHYNLKPYSCPYCDMSAGRKAVLKHIELTHPGEQLRVITTEIPDYPPENLDVHSNRRINKTEEEQNKMQCLYCEKFVSMKAVETHIHANVQMEFAKLGSVVVKCCNCLGLQKDLESYTAHHASAHPDLSVNYAFIKVKNEPREMLQCAHCKKNFMFLKDLTSHHNAVHEYLSIKYTVIPASTGASNDDNTKRKLLTCEIPVLKRVAKKSTTKLPMVNTVAKKSTTKLPMMIYDSDSDEEYSYYGTKPLPQENYANVTTLMPFFNKMVPFTLSKLSEIIKIDPKVIVKDIFKQ